MAVCSLQCVAVCWGRRTHPWPCASQCVGVDERTHGRVLLAHTPMPPQRQSAVVHLPCCWLEQLVSHCDCLLCRSTTLRFSSKRTCSMRSTTLVPLPLSAKVRSIVCLSAEQQLTCISVLLLHAPAACTNAHARSCGGVCVCVCVRVCVCGGGGGRGYRGYWRGTLCLFAITHNRTTTTTAPTISRAPY
jgi:hypothetical protein